MNIEDLIRQHLRDIAEEQQKAEKVRDAEQRGDINALNNWAEIEVKRGARPKTVFEDAFDLLNNELPDFEGKLTYKNRLELYFYLRILDEEFELMNSGNDASKYEVLKRIKEKKKHIKNILEFGFNQSNQPQETEPKPTERLTHEERARKAGKIAGANSSEKVKKRDQKIVLAHAYLSGQSLSETDSLAVIEWLIEASGNSNLNGETPFRKLADATGLTRQAIYKIIKKSNSPVNHG